jgi:flagellar hook-basal body complex protein FliE
MSDPLGLIGNSLNRVGGTPLPRTPAGGVPTDPSQPSFKDVLMDNIKQVNKLQQEATTAIEDLQTGRRADVEGVMIATQKADTAFRMLVSLRNKLAQATEEIKQMRT